MKRASVWAWLWAVVGLLYFFVPLYGTLDFSLRAKKGAISLLAYERVFTDPKFIESFLFSTRLAFITIVVSLLLVVPTAYWLHYKLPGVRPYVELVTLLPFVIPTIILVFGLLRTFGRPPLLLTATPQTTDIVLIGGYVVLSLPYMYRAVDTGLRAIDVRTLTEAAQSLGAGWPTILWSIIFPNLQVALLSGALLTYALVIGEFILASFLARPAFGPYLVLLGQSKAYEPAALTIASFTLTWMIIGLITVVSGGAPGRPGSFANAWAQVVKYFGALGRTRN